MANPPMEKVGYFITHPNVVVSQDVPVTQRPLSELGGATLLRRRLYLAWNLLGLVDILFVVVTAARFGIVNPDSMKRLFVLPLSLLPPSWCHSLSPVISFSFPGCVIHFASLHRSMPMRDLDRVRKS